MENIIQGKAKGKPTKQDKEWWKILKWAWEGHGQGMGRVRAGRMGWHGKGHGQGTGRFTNITNITYRFGRN